MRFLIAVLATFFAFVPMAYAEAATTPEFGYGALLVRMLLGLGAVCLIAVLALKYGLARFAPTSNDSGKLEVIDRLSLQPRQSIVVLRVAEHAVVVGLSDAGMQTLAQMPLSDYEGEPTKMFHVKHSTDSEAA